MMNQHSNSCEINSKHVIMTYILITVFTQNGFKISMLVMVVLQVREH